MTEFDDIRPYYDEEVPQVLEELLADPGFRKVASVAFPDVPFDALAREIRSFTGKKDFQIKIAYPLIWNLANKFSDGLTLDHSSLSDKSKAYTYISNHRDIILDSGFLSVLLYDEGMDTVEIAIGDNLFVYPWIKKLVRVNKSFVVQRALTMRQMLEASARMSRYMHHTIQDKNQSIWIAQREGRAKDSDDRTQESVLKMLAMGGEGDLIDRLCELNIAPLALSYEYDPCDYLKAQEFQLKRDIVAYKKTQKDDLLNMQTGLFGYKGRVHFQTSTLLNHDLQKLDRTQPKSTLFATIAQLLDNHIHRNYRIYPGNYVALDLLNNTEEHQSNYTSADKKRFEDYLNGQLDKITLADKDIPFLREKLLLMYANPLKNYLIATKQNEKHND